VHSIVQHTDLLNPPQIIKMSTAELAVSYAALILADDGVDITVRNLRNGCI
jgi:hypothetical protein